MTPVYEFREFSIVDVSVLNCIDLSEWFNSLVKVNRVSRPRKEVARPRELLHILSLIIGHIIE